MKLLLFLSIAIASTWGQSCDDFHDDTCPLGDENIVGSDTSSPDPQHCQDLCRSQNETCFYFTHFDTECYLLTTCDATEPCEGCVSGPADPLLSDCQDTTIGTTGDETTMVETTTMPASTIAKCDVNPGVLCEEEGNLIEQIEGISSASDCQAVCQNHPECNYWSHFAEEGPEHWGYCQLHYDCAITTDEECLPEGSHECPPVPQELYELLYQYLPSEHGKAPGGWKCHCTSGAAMPDLDECDDGTTTDEPSACADDFWSGWLCDEHENEIQHIEHISEPSDCQAICQNHPECNYFSHYVEEEGEHWGHCFLHIHCDKFSDRECHRMGRAGCPPASPLLESFFSQFQDDDTLSKEPRPGPHCNCICGPNYPDMDDCSSPEF